MRLNLRSLGLTTFLEAELYLEVKPLQISYIKDAGRIYV